MPTRAIVQMPGVLSGRWHFEGTSIPVAAVIADYRYGRDEALEPYRFMDLTSDEIDAALAFAFPAVREATIGVQYAAFMLSCECGEDVLTVAAWPNSEHIDCLCGRSWGVPLAMERRNRNP